jgi:hypothetical protein
MFGLWSHATGSACLSRLRSPCVTMQPREALARVVVILYWTSQSA